MARQQNTIWHSYFLNFVTLVWLVFPVWHWASGGRHYLLGNGGGDVWEKNVVGVICRVKWIEVRIQFLWLSAMQERSVSVNLHFFFLPLFICDSSIFARKKGQPGYCHCNLMCLPLAKYSVCIDWMYVHFYFRNQWALFYKMNILYQYLYFYGLFPRITPFRPDYWQSDFHYTSAGLKWFVDV